MIKEEILKELKRVYTNKPSRLQHVFGVVDTAIQLGNIHNVDTNKLELAALLHDITKYYTNKENVAVIKKHFKNSEEILNEYYAPILHSYSAYIVAKETFGVKDVDILDPIMYHTIGRKEMTIYEKIIFISDYIEPNRTYKACMEVRDIAFKDLDLAVYQAIDNSIVLFEKEGHVPKSAYEARNYYKQLLEEKNEKN